MTGDIVGAVTRMRRDRKIDPAEATALPKILLLPGTVGSSVPEAQHEEVVPFRAH